MSAKVEQEVKKLFAKHENEIDRLKKQEALLGIFAECLDDGCFDADDRVCVERKLQAIKQQRIASEEHLAKNKQLYLTKVRKVEEHLQQRQVYLEKCDAVFEVFPDLLEFFSAKQKVLHDELVAITNELQSI